MTTYIILFDNSYEKLVSTIYSILGQYSGKNNDLLYEILIINSTDTVISIQEIIKSTDISKDYIKILYDINTANIYAWFNYALLISNGDYIHFIHSGHELDNKTASTVTSFFYNNEDIDLIFIGDFNTKYKLNDISSSIIDLEEQPYLAPNMFYRSVVRRKRIKNIQFCTECKYDQEILFLWNVLLDKYKFGIINNVDYKDPDFLFDNYAAFPCASDKEWYVPCLTNGYLPYLNRFNSKVPDYIKYGIFYFILVRFLHNQELKDKHLFTNPRREFYPYCKEVFSFIDDKIILNVGNYKNLRYPVNLKKLFINIKYNYDIQQELILNSQNAQLLIAYNHISMTSTLSQKCIIDFINKEDNNYVIEISILKLVDTDNIKFIAKLNEKKIKLIATERYSEIKYFGEVIAKKLTFLLRIPFEKLQSDTNQISFTYEFNGIEAPVFIETSRFPARVCSGEKYSYWKSKPFILMLDTDNSAITINKYTSIFRFKREILYLSSILRKTKKMFIIRLLYWCTNWYFKDKNIWIMYDKFYKAGDNGEYFYKYCLNKHNPQISPYYVVNKKYPDAYRLKKEGLKPIYYGSLKHILLFLNSSIIATTHANIPVFSGLTPAGFKYVRDLLNADIVCIQHGLTVQNLAHNLNRQYDNLKRYYIASKYEKENLEQSMYGYYDKTILRLTGVPRYDGLKNEAKKQILLIPTWRSYISMPSSIGNTRPYSTTFKDSIYFKVINSLINNSELISIAEKYNYKILYVLHPTITSQMDDFDKNSVVDIYSPLDINYEKVFRESSLMITDYSGVQFDFAYMRKPVIYYHPVELPPHYSDSGFNYKRLGFGEICINEHELISTIKNYIQNECKLNTTYKQHIEDFFQFSDHNNCKRIYEDLIAMQNGEVENEDQ